MEETLNSLLASIPKLLEGKGTDMEEGWPVWAQCVVCYKEKVKDANVGDAKKIYGGCNFFFLPCVHVVCSKACLEKCRHEEEEDEEEEQSSVEKVVGGRTKAPVDGHPSPSRCPICDTSFSEALITSRITPLSLLGMDTLPKVEGRTIFVPRRCQACIRLNWASRFCSDCQTAMCIPCVKYHAMIPETMNHVMTANLDHLMESVSISEICPQHLGSRLIKQCITCEKQICEYCREHSEHNVSLLSEYAKSCKPHLDNIFKEFSTSLKRCQEIGEIFKKNYDENENKVVKLQNEKQTTLENIRTKIKNREPDMREDIVVKLTFKAFRLNVHASVLESLISQSERFFQYYECFNGPQMGVHNAGLIYRLIQKQMLYLRDRTNEIVNEPFGYVGIDVSRLDDTLKAIDNLCKFETVWTKKCPDAVCSGIDSSSVLSPPVSIHNDNANAMTEIPINNKPQTIQTKSKETQETANSLVSNQAGKNSAASKEATRALSSSSYIEENSEENVMEFQAFFIDNSSEEDEEDDTTGRIKKKKKIKIKTEPIERDDDRDEASEDDEEEVQIEEEISAEIEQNDDEATPAVVIKPEHVPRPNSVNSNVSKFYCNENSDSSSGSDYDMGEEHQEREYELPPFENHIIKVESGTKRDEMNSFSQKNHQENSETEEPESILQNAPSPSDDIETRREESSGDGFEERCGISSEKSSDEEKGETIFDALTGKMIPFPNYGSIKIKTKKAKSPAKNTNGFLETSEGQEKKLFLNPTLSPPKINSDLNYIKDENGRPVIQPPSLIQIEASDQREELEESTAVNTREVESAPITAAPLQHNNNNSESPSSSGAVFDDLRSKYSSASRMALQQKRINIDKSPPILKSNSSVGTPRKRQQQPKSRVDSVEKNANIETVAVIEQKKLESIPLPPDEPQKIFHPKHYLPSHWTKAMVDYYDSRPNIDFYLPRVVATMSDDIKFWKFIETGCPRANPRKGIRCFNCNQWGHLSRECTETKKKMVCNLCGEQEYDLNSYMKHRLKCTKSLCLNCGKSLPITFTRTFTRTQTGCEDCIKGDHSPKCTACNNVGHNSSHCPDEWRRYFSTTTLVNHADGSTEAFGEKPEYRSCKDSYCCNCCEKGHLAHQCPVPNNDNLYSMQTTKIINELPQAPKVANNEMVEKENPNCPPTVVPNFSQQYERRPFNYNDGLYNDNGNQFDQSACHGLHTDYRYHYNYDYQQYQLHPQAHRPSCFVPNRNNNRYHPYSANQDTHSRTQRRYRNNRKRKNRRKPKKDNVKSLL